MYKLILIFFFQAKDVDTLNKVVMLCYILCYASRKMPHSRRSAHKAPVMQSMQAKIWGVNNKHYSQ